MKKKNEIEKNRLSITKKNRISLNLLLSYLVILMAPLIAIVIIYFTAQNALINAQKDRIQNMVSEAALSFDREVREASNAGYYASREKRLYDYLAQARSIDRGKEFYELYTIAKHYPNYNLTNKIIENVYILIADSRFIIKTPQVIPKTEQGAATLGAFRFHSYEEFMEYYEKQDQNRKLFCYEDQDGKRILILPCEVRYPYSGTESGMVVVQLSWNQIETILRPILGGKEGIVALLDENDQILLSCQNTPKGGYQRSEQREFWQAVLEQQEIRPKAMMTCSKKTLYNGWKVVTMIPESVLTERIGAIRYVTIALSAVSILIGLLVCLTYWYMRKNMVQEYFSLQERLDKNSTKHKETLWFWKNFGGFLTNVDKLQQTLERQEVMIREDFLRKVLYGNFDSREQILEAAERADVSLEGYFYVVDMELEDPFKAELDCTKEEFTKILEEHLQTHLPWKYFLYKPSELSWVLILQMEEAVSGKEVKETLEMSNYEFYSCLRVQSYTGVSRMVRNPLEIARSFEVASRVSEFARYRGIRVPVLSAEFPEEQMQDPPLFFTIDMEMKLLQQIRSGTSEQLKETLEQIQEVYLKPGSSRYTYHHTIEILRSSLYRSIPAEEENLESRSLRERAHQAVNVEEIFHLLMEVKEYYLSAGADGEEHSPSLDREKVTAYLEQQCGDPAFNLSTAAEWLGEPERKLYHEFKDCFGISFSAYLEQMRMQRACEFLKQGMSVKDTAEQVGYSSDYSFRRAFKRVVGIPPSDFRKMQMN